MTATVPSMIGQFNMQNIKILLNMGYEVDVACNFKDRSVWTDEKEAAFEKQLSELHVRKIQIEYARSPYHVLKLIKSYLELKALIQKEGYTGLHCHTPVAAAVTRLAAKKAGIGTKVIYTAHGFHFYKGAPLHNWLIYYPIEKWLSKYTDVLITINKEDYQRAKKKFHAKKTVKIPGVGVDTDKFAPCKVDIKIKRAELGVEEKDFLLLSVSEWSARKNLKIVIDALRKMKSEGILEHIVYLVIGKGEMQNVFEQLIKQFDLEDHVRLLGFSADIDELCETVDCFVYLDTREGLGIAALEAMAAELPLIFLNANIKPRDGSSSINAYKVHIWKELQERAEKIKDYIIQPFISGREYTIDIFCDYEGHAVYITPRERLEVRAGEVLKTAIRQDGRMFEEMKKLIADFKPCGQITVQLIREASTGDDYYIEINPRFGGGAPLSMKAGADSAKAVLQLLNGERLSYSRALRRDGAVYSRFDQSICLNESA